MLAASEQAHGRGPTQREHVVAAEAGPDLGELLHAFLGRPGRDPGGVDRADGGPDEHVRLDAGVEQGLKHADLRGAEAAAAREHEGDTAMAAQQPWQIQPGLDRSVPVASHL